jgi:ubiquitin-like 1-activating enzyme E1 B
MGEEKQTAARQKTHPHFFSPCIHHYYQLATTPVLCVGAGGIGCELLKTLVLSGFRQLDVIDLDTIDVSNLNRQFLFRRAHVGQPKAVVAAGAAARLAPAGAIFADGRTPIPPPTITPHHGDVRGAGFGLDFFKRFALVLNGLDNLDARRHVNRLCLAARVPLIESGTAGHLGQVTVHLRRGGEGGGGGGAAGPSARPAWALPDPGRDSECYECVPKPVPKTYPVCTIRNTPDKPVHCIVWAKELCFPRLFGRADAVTDLDEAQGGSGGGGGEKENGGAENVGPAAGAGGPTSAPSSSSSFVRLLGEQTLPYAARMFDRLFTSDVARAAAMEDLWSGVQGGEGAAGGGGGGGRPPPCPLERGVLVPGETATEDAAVVTADPATAARGVARALGLPDAHALWSAADTARAFLAGVVSFHAHRAGEVGQATWDKDDALAVELVCAASNLRSLAYGIPLLSLFSAKGVAGNVIHAVATTNAVVAGLVTAEAIKLVAGASPACRVTWLVQQAAAGRLLVPTALPPPAPGCAVCGSATLECAVDTGAATLAFLVDTVLKKGLGLVAPSISTQGGFLYEEGEGLEADEVEENARLLPRALAGLPGGGLGHAAVAAVTDQATDLGLTLIITHVPGEAWDAPDAAAAHPDRYRLSGQQGQGGLRKGREVEGAGRARAASPSSSSGGVVVDEGGGEGEVGGPHLAGRKRARSPTPPR